MSNNNRKFIFKNNFSLIKIYLNESKYIKVLSKSIIANLSLLLLLFWIFILFIITRLFLHILFHYPIHLYCGDSGYYIFLSKYLNLASTDRPSGYSFILHLLNNNYIILIFFQHFISILSIVFFTISLYIKNIKFKWILLVSTLLIIYPHTAIMEKFIMPDSLANSILIFIISSMLYKNLKHVHLFVVSFLLGYLSLLRFNYFIFTIGLLIIILISFYRHKNYIKSIFFTVITITTLLIYQIYFIYPRLGVYSLNNFNGMLIFSRIARYFDCNQIISNSKFNKQFYLASKNICNNKLIKQRYGKILWGENSYINKIQRTSQLNRVELNSNFFRLSINLLFINPITILYELFYSVKDIFIANNLFYKNIYYPSLGGGCEIILNELNTNISKINNIKNYNYNFRNIFAIYASTIQKTLYLFSLFIYFLNLRFFLQYINKKSKLVLLINLVFFTTWNLYLYITLFLAGFDYRYFQPLFIMFIYNIVLFKYTEV